MVEQASADFGDKLWDNFRACNFGRAILNGLHTDVISKQSDNAKFDPAHVAVWSVDKIQATKNRLLRAPGAANFETVNSQSHH